MRILNLEVKPIAKILPSSDLRNKYNEISGFCNTYNEPVYITKNRELHRLLNEGLSAMKAGDGRPALDVFSNIEKEYGFDGRK